MHAGKYILISAAAVLMSAGIIAWIFMRQRAAESTRAVIKYKDEIILELDLDTVTETTVFTVGEPGSQNTIQISPEGIGVISADCPDQICVNQGIRPHGPEPIVCLPHKLIITFDDKGTTGLDAVTGR